MPDTETPAPPDKSMETIALSAATMGRDLVAALLYELRNMPDHWPRLNAELQQKTLERLKDKVGEAVLKAQHMLTTSEFQAVPAVLEYVGRKGGITGKISVVSEALCRHALFDAQGGKVLIVITDPDRWLQRMDELKVTGNQADLVERTDVDYDPSKDQPGYRRDQDPFAKGPTWEDLKKDLAITGKDGGTVPPAGDPPPTLICALCEHAHGPGTECPDTNCSCVGRFVPPSGDDPIIDPERVALQELRERLASSSIAVSLGLLKERSVEERAAAEHWLDAYEKNPKKCKIERPTWFPTDKGEK